MAVHRGVVAYGQVLGNQVPCSGPHPADKGVADRGHDKALPSADA